MANDLRRIDFESRVIKTADNRIVLSCDFAEYEKEEACFYKNYKVRYAKNKNFVRVRICQHTAEAIRDKINDIEQQSNTNLQETIKCCDDDTYFNIAEIIEEGGNK